MRPLTAKERRLVEEHASLPRMMANLAMKRIFRGHRQVDGEDLRSAGALALVRAAQRYDPAKACSFKTYATKRILGAMLDHVRQQRQYRGWSRARGQVAEIQAIGPSEDYPAKPISLDKLVLEREFWAFARTLKPRDQRILELTRAGQTQAQIAEQVGLCSSRVYQILDAKLGQWRQLSQSVMITSEQPQP